MANLSYWFGPRGNIGFVREVLQQGPTESSPKSLKGVIPAFAKVDSDGNTAPSGSASDPSYSQSGYLPAGTDRSGTASTTVGQVMAANTARRGGLIQNVSTGTIGVNEIGGNAAIGQPGTYTLPANGSMSLRTNRAISIIGSAANLSYTAIEF